MPSLERAAVEFNLAYPPHPVTGERTPNLKQRFAHECPADVVFFGGARGGGKTEWIGVDAGLNFLAYPGMLGFLFRRTQKEMQYNVIPILKRILGGIAKWSRTDYAFHFFNGGTLALAYLENEDTIGTYLGSEAGIVYIDQVEQLTEFTVGQAMSLLRAHGPRQLKLTGNPGLGVGVGWLRRWFVKPTADEVGHRRPPRPFDLWRPLPRRGDPTPLDQIPTRCFIPARFQDNDALVAKDPGYLGRIYAGFQLEIAKAQAEGDWDASDATIVGGCWQDSRTVQSTDASLLAMGFRPGQLIPWHVIDAPTWRPPIGARIYGSIDYGFGVPWSFHLHSTLAGGHSRTFLEGYETRLTDTKQAERIVEQLKATTFADGKTNILAGLEWMVFDPSMAASRAESGRAKSIIEEYQEVFLRAFGKSLPLMPGAAGRSARESRPNRWLDALATHADGLPTWTVTTACPHLIRTVPEIPRDPDDPDVEDDDSENHAYEDTGRFFEARPAPPRTAPPDPLQHLDQLSRAHQAAMRAKLDKPAGIKRIVVPGMSR